eukprot:TRINITY_DN48567_c0_g1_i1.p1 TRINITY_DN48567_c0_g1~~TRINITY_DN48567_c0_g1_i1.p1  ORF type:complete len:1375 (-),score=142.49 TRINITY_DN48567_c0_g1_i1:62-4186(-)
MLPGITSITQWSIAVGRNAALGNMVFNSPFALTSTTAATVALAWTIRLASMFVCGLGQNQHLIPNASSHTCHEIRGLQKSNDEASRTCDVSFMEVTIMGLHESINGVPNVAVSSRSIGYVLEHWMTQAVDFLTSGVALDDDFRDLWATLTLYGEALGQACPDAPILADLLWVAHWSLATTLVSQPWTVVAAERADFWVQSSLKRPRPQSATRVNAAAYAIDDFHDGLEGINRTAASTRQFVSARFGSLVAGFEESSPWHYPFQIPVGRSVELYGDGTSRMRAADSRSVKISDSLLQQATLELSAVLSVRSDEAWPIMETLSDLLDHGALRGSSLDMFEDGFARGHINFVAGVSSDGAWNKLVIDLTDALVDLKWEGCYLTERAEMVLTSVSPGVLHCMLKKDGSTLTAHISRYYVLDDGRRVHSLSSHADGQSYQPFASWGGSLPSELLKPWDLCVAWNTTLRCPAQSATVLRGWNGGSRTVLSFPVPHPSDKDEGADKSTESQKGRRLLAHWLDRRTASFRGNSLCFSVARVSKGFTVDYCCGTDPSRHPPPQGCWDKFLKPDICCTEQKHRCADVSAFTLDIHLPDSALFATQEAEAIDIGAGDFMRCYRDDLFQYVFDVVRASALEESGSFFGDVYNRLHDELTFTVFLFGTHPDMMFLCPEVAMLVNSVVLHRDCDLLLRQPLAPSNVGKQDYIRNQLAQIHEALLGVGNISGLVPWVLRLLTDGACGKVVHAAKEESATNQLQANYRWPEETIGGQSLAERGLPCAQGELVPVGQLSMGEGGSYAHTTDDTMRSFVDLGNPMPADGALTGLEFVLGFSEEPYVEVLVIRLEHSPSGPVYTRKATLLQRISDGESQGGAKLHVWKGDFLGFVLHGARMVNHATCSQCLVAELEGVEAATLSYLRAGVQFETGVVQLGTRHQRAYSWSAWLIPMECRPTLWHSAEFPARLTHTETTAREGPPFLKGSLPASSRIDCNSAAWAGDRVCSFSNVCYDMHDGTFSVRLHEADNFNSSVSLSAFSDGRSIWSPKVIPTKQSMDEDKSDAEKEVSVQWVEVPSYLLVRHAPQNWGHHVIEALLPVYALMLANEDVSVSSDERLIVFLDDCSLQLRGDAIEYCLRYDPEPLKCVKDIMSVCARFSRDLWPLLSAWSPLEIHHAADRLPEGTRHVCFSTLHVGLGPWRRPLQTVSTPGVNSWAADPLFAPVIRQFRARAVGRLWMSPHHGHSFVEKGALLAAVKTGRRSVLNREELFEWLEAGARSRGLPFAEVDFRLPLTDQIAMLSRARLLVASAGSSQFAGIFLQASGGMLVLPMCVSATGGIADCHSERLLQSGGLRWEEYAVDWKDLVFTIGRGFDVEVRRDSLERSLRRLLD